MTLTAGTHRIRRGQRLTLHGLVTWDNTRCALATKVPLPVIVLARPKRSGQFEPLATVAVRRGEHGYLWRLHVRPAVPTTYMAEANGQLPQGQIWQRARSRPFTVHVRHRAGGSVLSRELSEIPRRLPR